MKLIFPNLQNKEGKTISQLFTVHFLKFLQDDKGIKIEMVDLNNMVAEVEDTIDLDDCFNDYLNEIIHEGLLSYHYTAKLIGRGKFDIAKKVSNGAKISDFTKKIFELTEEEYQFKDMSEKVFAAHIEVLHSKMDNIKSYRCVQSIDENGSVCKVCGLVEGKKASVTERISLIADKCWKPYGQYEQLNGCNRCAEVLGLISDMVLLWRVNIMAKNRKIRYVIVPQFKIDTTEPIIIDKLIEYSKYFALFRTRITGATSIDYILNSLKAQPIIAKIVDSGEISLLVYPQSKSNLKGGFVTENLIDSQKIQKISEFAVFLNTYLPRSPKADAYAELKTEPRIISDTAYIYTKEGKVAGLRHLFTEIHINFNDLLEIFGGSKMLKCEYFSEEQAIQKQAIQKMNEYGWDNPLVRVSTFFVVDRANQANQKGKKPDQAITSPMALFNSVPEAQKNKIVRQYVEMITDNGKSYLLSKISEPQKFLSKFTEALNECTNTQLKEIGRMMRVFANSYLYKERKDKEAIFIETVKELGYKIKEVKEV